MKPDIFMDDFERTEWGDAHYSAVGRVLIFASRFEALCRTATAIVGIKEILSMLDSEEDIHKFVEGLHKMPLWKHIQKLTHDMKSLRKVLSRARMARNEIAHEIAIGLDCCLDSLPKENLTRFMEHLGELAIILAEGDRDVSLIVSLLTKEPIPTAEFLKDYPQRVKQWVTDIEDF